MRVAFTILLALSVAVSFLIAQHTHTEGQKHQKPVTITGEVVCLSCYLTHNAKGESHAKCAIACSKKNLPLGILTDDGKLFVLLEDHAKANAYQQLKKFADKKVTVTGTVHTRSGVTGIAVQEVKAASAAKSGAKYVCPMGCIPPQDKPGNCPKCGMKLVTKK